MLDALEESLQKKLSMLRDNCLKHGIYIRLARGFVNIFEHSELWRSCHTANQIDTAISKLQMDGCNFLAATMMHCNAYGHVPGIQRLPGFSWHNFGKAVDIELVAKDQKKIHHDLKDPLFCKFMDLLEEMGLSVNHHACDFDGFHIQEVNEDSPGDVYMPAVIDHEIYRSYRQ